MRSDNDNLGDASEPVQVRDGTVFIAWWQPYDKNRECFEGFEADDISLIGVYSTRSNAEAAVERSKMLPGFCDYPQGFAIDRYKLDQDHWETGFVMD